MRELSGLERARVPAPLIRRRLPSGRGATEQPNAVGDGDARLTGRFWVALALTGVATGMAGALLMVLLFGVEHLAWGDHRGDMLTNVELTSAAHRVAMLVLGGAIASIAWYALRSRTPGEQTEVDEVLWSGHGELSWRRSLGSSLISEAVIGLGASIGREQAPKLMGGLAGTLTGRYLGLGPAQRRLLVACGAGAGLAAVYNVPFGGALFTAEVLCGAVTIPVVLPALACSLLATMTAWWYLPDRATYRGLPTFHMGTGLVVWSLLAGLAIGLFSTGYIRLLGWVSHHRARGHAQLVAPLVAFALLGVAGISFPQLFGNGKDLAELAFLGHAGLGLLVVLAVLKPIATALCLGSGASGGLLTPTMSSGAALGGALGALWSLLWPGTAAGSYAVVGAAAMLGAGLQAPLAAIALVLELTGTSFALIVPLALATVTATIVARQLDGYSIYSARLPARPQGPARAAPPAGRVRAVQLLDEEAIGAALAGVAWVRKGHELVKVTRRQDFATALAYVNEVGKLAEESGHHPDIEISWNTVTLRLWTHSLGGITDVDLALARGIDELG